MTFFPNFLNLSSFFPNPLPRSHYVPTFGICLANAQTQRELAV